MNVLIWSFAGFAFTGCGNEQGIAEPEQNFMDDRPDQGPPDPNEPFYPFLDYIKDQIAYIDTTPFAIERTMIINDKMVDSGFVDKAAVRKAAVLFLNTDPNSPELKPLYRESSFRDLTINRLTFSITALRDSLPLQQVDILLNPDGQAVKNIILRKHIEQGDSMVDQHLLWVDKMHLQISEQITPATGKPYSRVTRIVWDRPLE